MARRRTMEAMLLALAALLSCCWLPRLITGLALILWGLWPYPRALGFSIARHPWLKWFQDLITFDWGPASLRYLLSGLYHLLGGLLSLAILALAIVLFIKGRNVG